MCTKLIQKTVDLDEGGKIDRTSRYRRILLGFNFSRIQRSFLEIAETFKIPIVWFVLALLFSVNKSFL